MGLLISNHRIRGADGRWPKSPVHPVLSFSIIRDSVDSRPAIQELGSEPGFTGFFKVVQSLLLVAHSSIKGFIEFSGPCRSWVWYFNAA